MSKLIPKEGYALYRRKDSKFVWARVYDDRGNLVATKSTRAADMRTAKAVAANLRRQALRTVDQRDSSTGQFKRLGDVIERYIATKSPEWSTVQRDCRDLHARHLLRVLGNVELEDPHALCLQYHQARSAEGVGASTVVRELGLMGAACKLAKLPWSADWVPNRGEAYNPADRLLCWHERTVDGKRVQYPNEVPAFLEAIETRFPQYLPHVILMLRAGLRYGEVCKLRLDDVDLEQGTVAVRTTKLKARGRRLNPIRVISPHPDVLEALRPYVEAGTELPTWHCATRDLRLACEDIGIERANCNSLRRTFIYACLQGSYARLNAAGRWDINELRTEVGHSPKSRTIEDYYARIWANQARDNRHRHLAVEVS